MRRKSSFNQMFFKNANESNAKSHALLLGLVLEVVLHLILEVIGDEAKVFRVHGVFARGQGAPLVDTG